MTYRENYAFRGNAAYHLGKAVHPQGFLTKEAPVMIEGRRVADKQKSPFAA